MDGDCVRPPRNEDKIQHFRVCKKKAHTNERKPANFPWPPWTLLANILCMHVILSRRCSSIVICGNNSATRRSRLARESESHIRHKKKVLHKKLSQIRLLYIFFRVCSKGEEQQTSSSELETRSSIYTPTDRSSAVIYGIARAAAKPFNNKFFSPSLLALARCCLMNENEKAISHNIGKWHLLRSQATIIRRPPP